MTTINGKYTFPLEDAYFSKTVLYNDGFTYVPTVPNGTLLKAPFDCKVKSAMRLNKTAQLPGFNFTEYEVYQLVLVSDDEKFLFSITDVLPNDKALNIGSSFKDGENIGRVLSPSFDGESGSGFAYKFYEQTITNPDAPKREQKTEYVSVDPDKIQPATTESAKAEQEAMQWKMPSKTTLFVVATMALVGYWIYKK